MKKYKPAIDKYFWIIWIFATIILAPCTILSFSNMTVLIIMILCDVFVYYFMVSSLFGYVELRKNSIYVKFGFILRREILYKKIRNINKERKIISYSFMSLKNAIEHVNIEYNKFDMITVSVVNNDDLIRELKMKISNLEVEYD